MPISSSDIAGVNARDAQARAEILERGLREFVHETRVRLDTIERALLGFGFDGIIAQDVEQELRNNREAYAPEAVGKK